VGLGGRPGLGDVDRVGVVGGDADHVEVAAEVTERLEVAEQKRDDRVALTRFGPHLPATAVGHRRSVANGDAARRMERAANISSKCVETLDSGHIFVLSG
jgi:hypothetical protein